MADTTKTRTTIEEDDWFGMDNLQDQFNNEGNDQRKENENMNNEGISIFFKTG